MKQIKTITRNTIHFSNKYLLIIYKNISIFVVSNNSEYYEISKNLYGYIKRNLHLILLQLLVQKYYNINSKASTLN